MSHCHFFFFSLITHSQVLHRLLGLEYRVFKGTLLSKNQRVKSPDITPETLEGEESLKDVIQGGTRFDFRKSILVGLKRKAIGVIFLK